MLNLLLFLLPCIGYVLGLWLGYRQGASQINKYYLQYLTLLRSNLKWEDKMQFDSWITATNAAIRTEKQKNVKL